MILSDSVLRDHLENGFIYIKPFPADIQIQPVSIDLRLGNEFLSPYGEDKPLIQDSYLIGAGECVLATTIEYIEVPVDLAGRVEGKSSWGRKFLQVHSTAGFIDPGFSGTITLELTNLSNVSQLLKAGVSICQISFEQIYGRVDRPYGSRDLGSHYQNQVGVTPSALPWV